MFGFFYVGIAPEMSIFGCIKSVGIKVEPVFRIGLHMLLHATFRTSGRNILSAKIVWLQVYNCAR